MASAFDTFGLKNLTNEPTRVTLQPAPLIDHIAVSNPENIPDSGISRVTLRDNYAVYCIREFMCSLTAQNYNF